MVPERQAAATAAWKAAGEAEVAKLEAEVGSELETGATGMSTVTAGAASLLWNDRAQE